MAEIRGLAKNGMLIRDLTELKQAVKLRRVRYKITFSLIFSLILIVYGLKMSMIWPNNMVEKFFYETKYSVKKPNRISTWTVYLIPESLHVTFGHEPFIFLVTDCKQISGLLFQKYFKTYFFQTCLNQFKFLKEFYAEGSESQEY